MNITFFVGALIAGILSIFGIAHHQNIKKPQIETKKIIQTVTPTGINTNSNPALQVTTPTPTGNALGQDIENFIYPGATKVGNSDSQITLQSSDDPNNISNWYQGKINSLSLGAKSVISTKTNGNVNILLDGANNTLEVKITITKNSGDSTALINVTLSSHPASGSTTNSVNRTIINNNINTSTDTSNTY